MINRRNANTSTMRWKLLLSVFIAHAALIAPLCWRFKGSVKQKTLTTINVKLGGTEPSHAPIVGEPMRLPPAPPAPAPAPEPEADPIPAPEPPAPKPEPKVTSSKPKVKQPKPKKTAKPKPKAKPKNTAKPKPKVKPKKSVKPQSKKTTQRKPTVKPKVKPKRREPDVFHDSRWDNFDPNRQYGSNTNKNVPIGRRDQGQKFGKVDNRTPAAGNAVNDAEYFGKLGTFLKERWKRPAGVLVDEETAVLIYIRVNSSGMVLSKRIEKPGSNPAVTRSVEAMLKTLDYIPRPPGGESEFTLKMVAED